MSVLSGEDHVVLETLVINITEYKIKTQHTREIDGIRATLAFEVLPEGLKIFDANEKDLASTLDTDFSAYQEAFHSIRVPEKAQQTLAQMHNEFYQSLVSSSLRTLAENS